MNICLLAREFPAETGGGGIGTHLQALSRGLAARQNTVVVLSSTTRSEGSYSYENGVHVYRIPFPHDYGFFNRLVYAFRVRETTLSLISRHGIQIVEAPEYGAESVFLELFGSPVPIVVRLHTGTYIVQRMQGKFPLHPAAILSSIFEWLAVALADAVTAPTQSMADKCANLFHLPRTTVDVFPNAVEAPEVFEKCPIAESNKQVLFVGRLERLKSPEILCGAIPQVIREFPKVNFFFIGADTNQGPHRSSVEAHCKALIGPDFLDKVRFLGRQPHEIVEEYLRKSDVFVLPSKFESFGVAYVEAMLYHLPVIACDGSGVEDVFPDGIAGLFVNQSDIQALQEAILQLLRDDGLRQKMGAAGRAFAIAHYSPSVVAKTHEDFYMSLIGTGQIRSR